MVTMFNTPQFNLLPDPNGIRWYGNVPNLVEVVNLRNQAHYVAMAVPTALFPMMKEVFKINPQTPATLSIDQIPHEDVRYVLSLLYGDTHLVDLWTYSERSLPAWIMNPKYFVNPSGVLIDTLLGG